MSKTSRISKDDFLIIPVLEKSLGRSREEILDSFSYVDQETADNIIGMLLSIDEDTFKRGVELFNRI